MRPVTRILLLAALAAAGAWPGARSGLLPGALPAAWAADTTATDTLGAPRPSVLEFTPEVREPGAGPTGRTTDSTQVTEVRWLSAPFGERLLAEPDAWRSRPGHAAHFAPSLDYNRVDLVRFGLTAEIQDPSTMAPRVGARFEYSTGRRRALFGVQMEQPLLPRSRLAVGVSMSRRTDHSDLQQVDDPENSLALLFAAQDYRDYFDCDGFGAYVAWRVPDFSVVSVHFRDDSYRSLQAQGGPRSLFLRDHELRANPAVTEGLVHALLLRLERQTRRTATTRAGLYHWIELERSGYGLGGEYDYTRGLADLRSVLRLHPSTTLALRAVAGHTFSGWLPLQKEFTAGGVDGLRAHPFGDYRGNQLALAQAEYTVALWRVRPSGFDAGLHAIAFVDAGRAWQDDGPSWDLARQHILVDGGFGLATSEQNLRVYVARNLQRPRAGAVISVRLQRPF